MGDPIKTITKDSDVRDINDARIPDVSNSDLGKFLHVNDLTGALEYAAAGGTQLYKHVIKYKSYYDNTATATIISDLQDTFISLFGKSLNSTTIQLLYDDSNFINWYDGQDHWHLKIGSVGGVMYGNTMYAAYNNIANWRPGILLLADTKIVQLYSGPIYPVFTTQKHVVNGTSIELSVTTDYADTNKEYAEFLVSETVQAL